MPSLHVALNALFLAPSASGGVETYLRGLAPALLRQRADLRLTVVSTRAGANALRASGWDRWCRLVAMPCDEGQRGPRQWCEQVKLPGWARRERVDVLHSLASVGPVWTPGVRHVVTLHDVTMFHEATFGWITTHGMRTVIRGAARDADGLLAVTSTARDEIASTLSIDRRRLVVAHHGREAVMDGPLAAEADVRRAYAVEGRRIVLCVAAKRPHKNQELLLRALPALPDDVVLVLAGRPEQYAERLTNLARRLGVEHRVRSPDWVPDADLAALWGIADCAAFPTRAEGFGMPVLDALGRGVPVACSDLPVLREVAGNLPEWFAPDDVNGCLAAIRACLDSDPARAAAGRAHVARFTWDASAARTLEAYDRALSGP